jgi:hypothetical protein
MVRDNPPRVDAGGLFKLRSGSMLALAKGLGVSNGRGCASASGAAAASSDGKACDGGSTLKLVPHFGQRIFRPFSGTRLSST